MVRFTLILSVLVVGPTLAGASSPDEEVYSGPQSGERITPFKVLGIAGPNAGQEHELAGASHAGPTLLVFVHEVTRPAFQLMRPIDAYAAKYAGDGLHTHFVWLTADRSKTEDWLRTARGSLNLKSPIAISLDGIEGPGAYGLNRKVTLTILVAMDYKVVANFAIIQPNETDAPKVIEAMAKVMGKSAPTLDELRSEFGYGRGREMTRARPKNEPAAMAERTRLPDDPLQQVQDIERRLAAGANEQAVTGESVLRIEGQVARLQARDQEHHARSIARIAELEKMIAELVAALNDARAQIARLEGSPPPPPLKKPAESAEPAGARPSSEPRQRPAQNLPGRTPSDPELIGLMRRMIQPNNDAATVNEVRDAMRKWAGDNPERRDDLAQFAKRIAHLGYGTEAAKAAIRELAEAK